MPAELTDAPQGPEPIAAQVARIRDLLPTTMGSAEIRETIAADIRARSFYVSRMGKATAELKTKVPECVKDEFTSLAHALGLNESELLRSLVMVRLYGVEGAERMHSTQLRAAAGIGPDWAPTAAAGA